MIEEDLYSHLSTYAGLTALVGDRVYPVAAPQGIKPPFCVFLKVSNQRQYSHQGFSNLEQARLQVSCYADDPLEAKQVAAQVTAAMEAWPGVNVKAQAVFQDDETDLHDEYQSTGLYHVSVDFLVWYG